MSDRQDDIERELHEQLDVAADAGDPLSRELNRQVTLAAARASELRDVGNEIRAVADEVKSLHRNLTDDLDASLVEQIAVVAERNTIRSSLSLGLAFGSTLLSLLAMYITTH